MKYINTTNHFKIRIFNGALKLKIETSLDEPSINIDSILGTWTFADVENYGGFIYKKDITNELNDNFAIIKVCYNTPLQIWKKFQKFLFNMTYMVT